MRVKPYDITIRYTNGTYTARCQGKTASCTSGADWAAKAVAKKVMDDQAHTVVRVSGDKGGRELWKII
jgi:phosphosulfolactate phosphohydrolase-like enzyme